MNWWLPPQASTFAPTIDTIFTVILVITGLALVIVESGLIWFSIKYRERPGRKAYYTHGNAKAEYIWTAVPAVVVVGLALVSNHYWTQIKGRNSVPADAYPIKVHAKQFEWLFTYPGPDGQLGTGDDITDVRNKLHVPLGRAVVLEEESEDVIHSVFVPAFRLKQDAVPGMHIRAWFIATKLGEYDMGCAELCGMGHYKMGAKVTVQSQADFDAWLAKAAQGDIE
ncbi:MAG TPA: cytochrome c oxidase subunit II [Gemmatimonadaceae bacterium]